MRILVIIKILLNLHIEVFAQNKPAFNIVPNPFKDTTSFIFTLPESDTVSLVVYNRLGELLYDQSLIDQLIDLSYLSGGIYILHIDQGETILRKKIIKL